MHPTSLRRMEDFFVRYLDPHDSILDVGSMSVNSNGTYRDVLSAFAYANSYTGLDREQGPNVDVVVHSDHSWPFKDGEFDIVISGQMLEHSEFFWETFKEAVRVCKSGGYLCMIAPKIQKTHNFPVDCWRFLPDGMRALAKWTGIACLEADSEHVSFAEPINRPIDCWGVFQK